MPRDRSLQNTGPTAAAVRDHIRTIRAGKGLSLAAVCARLAEMGRPFAVSSLSEVENGKRRVDVDDLVVLAAALGVTPITLLMPLASSGEEAVAATGVGSVPARALWSWLCAASPLTPTSDRATSMRFALDAQPAWRLDSDETTPEYSIGEPPPADPKTGRSE